MEFTYGTISAKRVQEITDMKIPAPGIYCGFKEFYEAGEREYYAHSEDERILFFQAFTPLHDQIVLGKDDKPVFVYIYGDEWFYIEFEGYEMLKTEKRNGIDYDHYILEVKRNEKIDKREDKDELLHRFREVRTAHVNGEALVWHQDHIDTIEIKYEGVIYK